jgi:hypothetical protein
MNVSAALAVLTSKADVCSATAYVRFGSKADICSAAAHVRFTPNSDRESGLPANAHVRFTPKSGLMQRTSACLLWANSGRPPSPALRRAKRTCLSYVSRIRTNGWSGYFDPEPAPLIQSSDWHPPLIQKFGNQLSA